MKTIYVADDGERFDTAEACRAHEERGDYLILEGLTANDIQDALARRNTGLADALEKIGATIAKARRDAGYLRRTRKGKETGAAQSALQGAAEPNDGAAPDSIADQFEEEMPL